MWILLAWQIQHILTKWVSFIGSSTCHVRSSPPSGQGTWSPSRFIFSIVVSFFVYIFTTMCCTWLVFGWSITLFFRICVLAIKFGGMICPKFAYSCIPIVTPGKFKLLRNPWYCWGNNIREIQTLKEIIDIIVEETISTCFYKQI